MARKSGGRRAPLAAMVFAAYCTLSLLLFCRTFSWNSFLLAAAGGDPWTSVWFLNWWVWAPAHGYSPLVSPFVYAPAGYDLTWATSIPAAALLAAPMTLTFGAAVAFNVLSLLAPALSAFCAFVLVRRSVGSGLATAFVCGGLFGFSTYEVAQLSGHLNLDLTFPVPLVCLAVVERVRGFLGRRAFIACLTVLLVTEFGISTEIFASLVSLGVPTLLLWLICAEPPLRARFFRAAGDMAVVLVLVGVIVSPWLVHMALARLLFPAFINLPWVYSTNLENLVVPTAATAIGGDLFRPVSTQFSGGLAEQGGYLGLPLVLVLLHLAWQRGRERKVAALLITIGGLIVASLGPSLHVGTWDSRLPLPWWIGTHLPLLKGAAPCRFSLYVALGTALAAALWQAGARGPNQRATRLLVLVAAWSMLLPNTGRFHWNRMKLLPFFEPAQASARLPPNANILILPYLASKDDATPAMLWQWQSGMRFRQAGGYLSFVPLADLRSQFVHNLMQNQPSTFFANDMSAFVAGKGVSAIVAAPGTSATLVAALRRLGWPEEQTGGVDLFRVPPAETLHYAALAGDIWHAWGSASLMGATADVTTHRQAAILHVSDALFPTPDTVLTVQNDAGATTDFAIPAHGARDIDLPPDGHFTLRAGATFVPALAWPNNNDRRSLSFVLTIEPR